MAKKIDGWRSPDGRFHTCRPIGPTEARELLDRNTANRAVRPWGVAKYARIAAAGEWRPSAGRVVIGKDGILKDGQNRLLGIERAGATVMLDMVLDAENDVAPYIDDGTRRNGSDAVAITSGGAGEDDKIRSSALKLAFLAQHSREHSGINGGGSYNKSATNADVARMNIEHKDALDALCLSTRTMDRCMRAAVIAAAIVRPELSVDAVAETVRDIRIPFEAKEKSRHYFSALMKAL